MEAPPRLNVEHYRRGLRFHKMMKKKYTSILLVLALCLTVTACGGKAIIIERFFVCFIDIPFASAIMKLAGNVNGNVYRSAGFAGNDLCEEYTGCTT